MMRQLLPSTGALPVAGVAALSCTPSLSSAACFCNMLRRFGQRPVSATPPQGRPRHNYDIDAPLQAQDV
jgi:hypothetical protein